MLIRLEIQNYAIIDKLEITFPAGLAIITGKTGAGKSILLGALGLIMGKRADTKVLYDQDRKCFVEATFDISSYSLHEFFFQNELDYFDEVSIRREIAPGGKSRAFINDTPVTLDILQELAESLIDIHQQFDTLDIQHPKFQVQMIDVLADNKILLEQYSGVFNTYKSNKKNLEDLVLKNYNTNQEMEFLKFQMDEFIQAELKDDEQNEIEARLIKLTSAEEIKKNASLLYHVIEDDENALISQLQTLINQFSSIKNLDRKYTDIYDRLNAVREEMSDIAKDASRIADYVEYDGELIQNLTARLNLINRLQKKHHVNTMEDLLSVERDIQKKLDSYADISREIMNLESDIKKSESELFEIASQISHKRKAIIPAFEKDVHELLATMAMPHAYIKINLSKAEELTPNGLDYVNILFAPNKGSVYLPLKDVASGGEMSRLAICMKSLLAGATTLPTLVFDEIDTGVSGDVAQKMGGILYRLSLKHQVICITHSPQIAAKAQSHYWVYKTDDAHRTKTSMKLLNDQERIIEIATMLSGNPPTEAAKANAMELIGNK